ncbi:ABATE domain-containing protein [Streptomyces sp. NBC_01476]|uniref:CGNR zinc finger domain-containing protein n=1 Tax=Streptomyces sp. NBC_01476 TaxID=2903881 RepID=UPI002E2FB7DE|nr:ABATE domain-containing protein [Streptomyces sp. NBC_01476]
MNISTGVEDFQSAGFPMGGEPLVALDLADTLITVGDPPADLIAAPAAGAAWWELQARRLPPGPVPEPVAVRRLRTAVREVLDARLEGRAADPAALEDINAAAASAPSSPRLVADGDGLHAGTRWHTEYGGNARLAAIAAEVIALLTSPARAELLRRCANPDCSMLFLAENRRRKWCTANLCGNRIRVARHYDRTHRQEQR